MIIFSFSVSFLQPHLLQKKGKKQKHKASRSDASFSIPHAIKIFFLTIYTESEIV